MGPEYEGPVTIHQLAPGVIMVRPAESQSVPAGQHEESRCAKCAMRFDPADTSFEGRAQHRDTPFCNGCVSRCHDTEIADHWCSVDQWRTDKGKGAPDAV